MIRTSLDVPLLNPALSNHRKRYLTLIGVSLLLLLVWGAYGYIVANNNNNDECNDMFIMTTALGNLWITLFIVMFAGGYYFHHKTKSIVLELQLVILTPIYGLMMMYSFSECAKENTLASIYIRLMFTAISIVILLLVCSILINLCHWIYFGKKVEFGENEEQDYQTRLSTISEGTKEAFEEMKDTVNEAYKELSEKHDINEIV